MRKTRWLTITAVFLFLAGSAVAQNWQSPKTTTTVPFEFVVNGTTLPAGTYIVRTNINGFMLMIQNEDRPEYVKYINNNDVMLNSGVTHASSKLVFMLDQGRHVLHQICVEGDNHTHDLLHGPDVAELVATR
jgi:hypothetical protein